MVRKTDQNLCRRFPKRIDPEFTYAYDNGDLLQISGTYEVIGRWKLSDAPAAVVIDAIASYDFEDEVPQHLVTDGQRRNFLQDLIAFGVRKFYPKTRLPTQRVVRKISDRAAALLIDALSNSMDLYSEDDFVDWVGSETELTAGAIRLVYQKYWDLDPLERGRFADAEWAQWIHYSLFNLKSKLG